MLKDFFSNVTILIASFTVMGQVFKNMPLSPSSSHSTNIPPKLTEGILFQHFKYKTEGF
jgi:hypothetical protein